MADQPLTHEETAALTLAMLEACEQGKPHLAVEVAALADDPEKLREIMAGTPEKTEK